MQSKPGKFERAHSGTIFLDEIIELSPRAQAALLRVLQEGELERVGGSQTRKIDVRVVAATNENLLEAVQQGRFRADLYYRLNTFPVFIPPLRERRQDIPLLIQYFLKKYTALYQKNIPGISDYGRELLLNHPWPGNIRELENVIERGVILTDHNRPIQAEALFARLAAAPALLAISAQASTLASAPAGSSNEAYIQNLLETDFNLDKWNEQIMLAAIQQSGGNISDAARKLGISRPTLAYQLKKYRQEDLNP